MICNIYRSEIAVPISGNAEVVLPFPHACQEAQSQISLEPRADLNQRLVQHAHRHTGPLAHAQV